MRRMAGRRDQARYDSRRRSIVDAAASVFRAKGYEGARLEDIADVLGVTKASVYYYFPKKSDLLLEICALAVEDSLVRQERILQVDSPVDERLREAISDHVRGMASNFAFWSIFFREFDLGLAKDPRRKKIQASLREFGRRFEDLIDEGVQTGTFRPVNVGVISNAILGMLNWSNRWIHNEDPSEVVDAIVGFVEQGLLAR
jgi:AcrR family transcriptional regulator